MIAWSPTMAPWPMRGPMAADWLHLAFFGLHRRTVLPRWHADIAHRPKHLSKSLNTQNMWGESDLPLPIVMSANNHFFPGANSLSFVNIRSVRKCTSSLRFQIISGIRVELSARLPYLRTTTRHAFAGTGRAICS
jgi:hypothetical protein